MSVKIASAQYDIGFLENWQNYQNKISRWVTDAANEQARILLFPEYASMELASLFEKSVYSSLSDQLDSMQTLLDPYLENFQNLAEKYNLYIQPGTFPVKTESGLFHNRAYFFMPDGRVDFQDKLQMTRFENEQWLISSGLELKVFNTEFGKIAINICYDSEFPLFARRQVEAGVKLILVPSCTDTLAGYHRVRIACQARALESQCYVAQASTVGKAPWSNAVNINIGAAAVYTPIDRGFPDDGILNMGKLNNTQWIYAEISPEKVDNVRFQGQVFNYREWPLQNKFIQTVNEK